MKKLFLLFIILSLSFITLFSGCSKNNQTKDIEIAVFVPGIVSGSPVYEMLVAGIDEAITEYNNPIEEKSSRQKAVLSIMEAGTNQSEWSGKMTSLVAQQKFDVIISSNPSLPDLIAPLTEQFPEQKFIILDAFLEGNPSIKTVRYNQREQAYFSGYIAGLVTKASKEQMKYANSKKKIALVAAQEYPVMNDILFPGFVEGARAVDPEIDVDFTIIGNWYDAAKASEISKALYNTGVDVILPICGGAAQGVIASAKECGFYITWFDDNGFAKAPGYIISSSVVAQKKSAYEATTAFLNGNIEFGKAEILGIKDGYVDFIQDDENYLTSVDESIRKAVETEFQKVKNGEKELPSK